MIYRRKKIWKRLCGELSKVISEGQTLRYFISCVEDKIGMPLSDRQAVEFLKVIYAANFRSVYAAERYCQKLHIIERRPYWRYRFTDLDDEPETHAALAGKVFQYDDPVWDTNYPPNAWNCHCLVDSLAPRDMEREKLTVSNVSRFECIANEGWDFNPGKKFPVDSEQEIFFGKNFPLLGRDGQILQCDDDLMKMGFLKKVK